MADLESRVDKLEEKVAELDISITKSLSEIKVDLADIKASLKGNSNSEDLKNDIIKNAVKANSDRIAALEGNQSKVVWTFITAFIGLAIEAVIFYIRTK